MEITGLDSSDTRQAIRAFLSERLAQRMDHEPFGDSSPLVSSGRLDSLSVVDVVMFLETGYGLDFMRIGFDSSLLDSVDAIVALIAAERENGARA